MNKPNKQQWLDFVEEQKQSDLSITQFCRHKNISADNFYYHRGQLLNKKKADSSPFVHAQVKKSTSSFKQQPSLTLIVGCSQLHLPATVSPQWLAALMAALV